MADSTAQIPVIDLSGPEADTAARLVNAAIDHGFLYIKNTGADISAKATEGAFEISKKIFNAPLEEKQECTIQTNNRGWSGMHSETLDPGNQKVGDFKEAFNFGEFLNGKAQQPVPSTVQSDEADIASFSASCHALCRKILRLLGLGLAVNEFFSSAHDPSSGASPSILRLLRYPPPSSTSHSQEDVRAGAHSDYGSITLLFRLKGQAGLELLSKENKWLPVPVCPPGTQDDPSPPILINIGDLLSYWTGGLFRSTVHRVSFPTGKKEDQVSGETSDGTRYSIAFFCHPVGSTLLEPVPSDQVKEYVASGQEGPESLNPYAKRKVLTADEHLFARLKASYGDLYDGEKNT